MTKLRQGGRALRAENQRPLSGDVHTKRFKAGDTWVKVLAFHQSNCAPGMIELYDPKVKECVQHQATMVLAGLEKDEDAWVVQEWKIEVSPPPLETPIGRGWLKPERGSRTMDRIGVSHGLMVVEVFYENVSTPEGNVVLEFRPRSGDPMLIACLWSRWTNFMWASVLAATTGGDA